MYQAFEDYACPTQFPVDLKTDEKRLVSRYIVFWLFGDYFPSPCMTTKSRNGSIYNYIFQVWGMGKT